MFLDDYFLLISQDLLHPIIAQLLQRPIGQIKIIFFRAGHFPLENFLIRSSSRCIIIQECRWIMIVEIQRILAQRERPTPGCVSKLHGIVALRHGYFEGIAEGKGILRRKLRRFLIEPASSHFPFLPRSFRQGFPLHRIQQEARFQHKAVVVHPRHFRLLERIPPFLELVQFRQRQFPRQFIMLLSASRRAQSSQHSRVGIIIHHRHFQQPRA